jgi:hypothetical protein
MLTEKTAILSVIYRLPHSSNPSFLESNDSVIKKSKVRVDNVIVANDNNHTSKNQDIVKLNVGFMKRG